MKELFHGHPEDPGQLERQPYRRRILTLLDRQYRLSGNADPVGKLLLGQPVRRQPVTADVVSDVVARLHGTYVQLTVLFVKFILHFTDSAHISVASSCHKWQLTGMKWSDLIHLVGEEPVFEASMLFASGESPARLRRQLSRWTSAGRLLQLRRGLYVIAPPFAKLVPHLFAVAARLYPPSYVSLESALAYHGLIPESVPVVMSVTTRRPREFSGQLGMFIFRHLKPSLFWGYTEVRPDDRQSFFIASAEKALLDLFHLTTSPIDEAFLHELRLDAADGLNPERLNQLAARTRKPKLIRTAALTSRWMEQARRESERR